MDILKLFSSFLVNNIIAPKIDECTSGLQNANFDNAGQVHRLQSALSLLNSFKSEMDNIVGQFNKAMNENPASIAPVISDASSEG